MGRIVINGFTTRVTIGSNGVPAAAVPTAQFSPTPIPNIGRSGDSPECYSFYVARDRTVLPCLGAARVFVDGKPVHVPGDATLNDSAPGGRVHHELAENAEVYVR